MHIEYCVRKPKHGRGKKINSVREGIELSSSIFSDLVKEMKGEKHLLEVGSESLRMSYQDGFGVVALAEGKPIGHTRLSFLLGREDPLGGWLELGSTWVHKDFRGNGVNRDMYQLLLPLHSNTYNILATTTNIGSIAVGEEFGFVPVPRKALPEKIWKNSCCCPLEKTQASDSTNHDCRLAHGESQHIPGIAPACWFRVTPETAKRLNLVSALA